MKNSRIIQKEIFNVIIILLISVTLVLCLNDQKAKDTKEVAEVQNDAKFKDNDKEKDAQFLVNVTEINLEENSLGQLAQKIRNRADIMEFGKMMETEHTKSLTELTQLAQQKLVTISTSSTDDAVEAYKKMENKS